MAGEGAEALGAPKVRRGNNYQVDISRLPIARPKPSHSTIESWRPALHEDDPYWQRRDRFSKTIPVTGGPAQALWPDYCIGSKIWSIEEEKDFVLGIFLFEKNFKPISRFIGDGQQKNFIQCRWYYYNKFKRSLSPLYRAFKQSSLHHSKEQHVRGSLMVLGNRGRKLLTRLFHHITDSKVQDRITEAHSKMARNEISLEKFVRLLKKHSSSLKLWAAFAIGQEDDLSSCYYHLFTEKSTKRSRLVANSRYRDCTTLEIQEELAQMDIRSTPTNQMSDLFHMGVWPRLERLGWHLETVQKGNGRNMVYYCCPSLVRFTKGAQRGIEYFDASRALLSYVAQNLSVLDENPGTPVDDPVSILEPQYQGVERRGDRWRAYVMFEPEDGQSELVELGEFITADRAAAAHDIAALKYIGQVAPRNFTHDFEQDEGLARMSATEAAEWLQQQATLPLSPPALQTGGLRSSHPFSPPITPRPGAFSGGFTPCFSEPMKSPRMQRPAPLSLSRMLQRAAEAAGQPDAGRLGNGDEMECEEEAGSPAVLQLALVRKGETAGFSSLHSPKMEAGAWTEQQAAASLIAHALPNETSSAQLSHQMAAIDLQAVDTASSELAGASGQALVMGTDATGQPAGAMGPSADQKLLAEGTHEGDPSHWWMKGYLQARAAIERRRGGSPDGDESDEGRSSRGRGRFFRKGSEGLEGQIGAGRHVCHDCGLTFETGQQLGGHRIVHKRPAGGDRFQCRTCGKGFDTLQALGGHQKIHQPAHRTKVQKDEQDAYGKADGHSSQAPGPGWLQCPTCLDWFKNGHALGGHQRVHGGQQFPPMKGIRSGPKPPPELNVFQPREAKPVQRFAAVAKEEDLDDEEVLGEIIYRNPEDDFDEEDYGEEDGEDISDAFGMLVRRKVGRFRLKKSGKYKCRKCDATFPTSRGRDGHQRMHGPSAGAVIRSGPPAEHLQGGTDHRDPYAAEEAAWSSDEHVPITKEGEEWPHSREPQHNGLGEPGAEPTVAHLPENLSPAQAEERRQEAAAAGGNDATPPAGTAPAEVLPFTAARSRRSRKPRRFESFEWQTEEWRREETVDETPTPVAAERSGSDADMESTGSERDIQVFACNECTAVFPSARSLGSHRKLHRSERRRRAEELRAMSEDANYMSDGGMTADRKNRAPHDGVAGGPERARVEEAQVKPRVIEVGREVYGGCILPNGRYQCNTCFKDFGTGQALGGHQRIHSSGPAVAKKKAPKALAKLRAAAVRKSVPGSYQARELQKLEYRGPRESGLQRPPSATGSRCVVRVHPAWRDDGEEKEDDVENESGWRNRAEESPMRGSKAAPRWEANKGNGDSDCEDSAELLMAIHFQKQEQERRAEAGTGQRPGSKPVTASPLGATARQWVGGEQSAPAEDVEMATAGVGEVAAPAAQPLEQRPGPTQQKAAAGEDGAASTAARLSSEWAENVPIGQSSVFFQHRAQQEAWQGGEKRKRVLSQLPGASSPDSSPANSPQANNAPSRFHTSSFPAQYGSSHVAIPQRPISMGTPGGVGLSRYGTQALHGQRGQHDPIGRPDPRFLSTLKPHPTTMHSKVGYGKPHQCSECGAEFETGAALGGHVGKHRRESEKLARGRDGLAGLTSSPGRDLIRSSISRVGMSLTPRGGNVKPATARHQAPKKRIMVKFQAQQQQQTPPGHPLLLAQPGPLSSQPAHPRALAPQQLHPGPPPGSAALANQRVLGVPRQQYPGQHPLSGSPLAPAKAPLRLTVQVAPTPPAAPPARAVRSPSFGREDRPRGGTASASPDPTPRARDVAVVLQNWKAQMEGSGAQRQGTQAVQRVAPCGNPTLTDGTPRTELQTQPVKALGLGKLSVPSVTLTVPHGKPDPEAPMPKVMSPGKATNPTRIPMGPLHPDASNMLHRSPASPASVAKGILAEHFTLSPRSRVH